MTYRDISQNGRIALWRSWAVTRGGGGGGGGGDDDDDDDDDDDEFQKHGSLGRKDWRRMLWH